MAELARAAGRATAVLRPPVVRRLGRVRSVDGSLIGVGGLTAPVGSIVRLGDDRRGARAGVVTSAVESCQLMSLDRTAVPQSGDLAEIVGDAFAPRIGQANLSRVVDALGNALDGGPPLRGDACWLMASTRVQAGRVTEPFDCGVRAINGLMTLGKGQRVGLIGGSGVGKSVLIDMLRRYAQADVVVAALIGERSREIADFIAGLRDEAGSRTAVVAVPASEPALARIYGAWRATALAEYFRAQGKSVLLIFDSLTRVAHAAREVGIAIGETLPPSGFPPSALNLITQLIERAGTSAGGQGAITAIYTILADGDDMLAPVVDTARAILDGHIILSRELAARRHFPAIDIANSVSRTMPQVAKRLHVEAAARLMREHALVERNRDLVAMGAYAPGRDAALDAALARWPAIERYLAQGADQRVDLNESVRGLDDLMHVP